MTPFEFLERQVENVDQALKDTLRYDYGPDQTRPYYHECKARLNRVKNTISRISKTDFPIIHARLNELADLADWISLIERSRLGEFSWPFAEEIRTLAEALLSESHLAHKTIRPIVHVVAEGEGYLIDYETRSPSDDHRFAVVAFPRALKHHVLLHALFGHELGHTALHTDDAGHILQSEVMAALESSGPISTAGDVTAWLNDNNAPIQIKSALAKYSADHGQAYQFEEDYRIQWLDELVCDLFGLVLFGPGFAAAHQVYLRPIHPEPYEFELVAPTHPPYAIRQRMLTQVMRILHWDTPITDDTHPECHHAETALLAYVLDDPYVPWSSLFSEAQLQAAIAGVQKVFSTYGALGYEQPTPERLAALVKRLTNRLPPILAQLDNRGRPLLTKVNMAQILYAGWLYWFGRHHLTASPLSFLLTNKLCDLALLQQRAIDAVTARRRRSTRRGSK